MDAEERIAYLERLGELRGSKVLVYFSYRPLDDTILVPLYKQLKEIGHTKRIDLLLHSYGGAVDTPFKIVMLIREFCDEFSVIVPFVAKSAASMVVLGADEVVMGPVSELGPIDPLVKHPVYKDLWVPVQAVQHCLDYLQRSIVDSPDQDVAISILSPVLNKLDPWLIGDYEKALKASRQYAEALLSRYMLRDNPELVQVVTKVLTEGYFSHGYPIGRQEAKQLGLKVFEADGELWDVIWELYLGYEELFLVGEEE
ncbi:Serine dehydrogenase proteinase [Acididesulfobacillus acetoxydans]|uniref:Serine dehydrogenase proteinase n=1 Tax=Acididesulfobacillus acetoxydans TaxID=1561005 RepID=A0A8S0XXI3_9FIRM|nr:peptidase [Acididesulfobacillus acetoxydans]CAA7601757.1 Serine dehydrogenase proteinase [Acididesulfobacillus acetoxydans]CEJ09024.1 Serine dehydrogenase proteinase [Acididesulfobacillus acetoxydans]